MKIAYDGSSGRACVRLHGLALVVYVCGGPMTTTRMNITSAACHRQEKKPCTLPIVWLYTNRDTDAGSHQCNKAACDTDSSKSRATTCNLPNRCISFQPWPSRFEFRAVPHGGSLKVETEGGGKDCYTVHAGGPQHRRAKGNGSTCTTTKKRKRAPSSRRGPGNDRAGSGGGVSSVPAASQCSAPMNSGLRADLQV